MGPPDRTMAPRYRRLRLLQQRLGGLRHPKRQAAEEKTWCLAPPPVAAEELSEAPAPARAESRGRLFWRRQLARGGGIDRQPDGPLGRPRHLRCIHEAQLPVAHLDHEAVQDVLPVVVDNLVNRADLLPVRRVDRGAALDRRVMNRIAVVRSHALKYTNGRLLGAGSDGIPAVSRGSAEPFITENACTPRRAAPRSGTSSRRPASRT